MRGRDNGIRRVESGDNRIRRGGGWSEWDKEGRDNGVRRVEIMGLGGLR